MKGYMVVIAHTYTSTIIMIIKTNTHTHTKWIFCFYICAVYVKTDVKHMRIMVYGVMCWIFGFKRCITICNAYISGGPYGRSYGKIIFWSSLHIHGSEVKNWYIFSQRLRIKAKNGLFLLLAVFEHRKADYGT